MNDSPEKIIKSVSLAREMMWANLEIEKAHADLKRIMQEIKELQLDASLIEQIAQVLRAEHDSDYENIEF